MTDNRQPKSNDRDHVIAEFAITSSTPASVVAMAKQTRAELDAAMADFDLTGDDEPSDQPPVTPSPALIAARLKKNSVEAAQLIANNKKYGHTAQAMDAIDAHRAGPGRLERNEDRREVYADFIKETEDRDVGNYVKNPTPEHRKEQKAESRRKARERFDLLPPEEQQAVRDQVAAKKRAKRQQESEAAAATLAARTIF